MFVEPSRTWPFLSIFPARNVCVHFLSVSCFLAAQPIPFSWFELWRIFLNFLQPRVTISIVCLTILCRYFWLLNDSVSSKRSRKMYNVEGWNGMTCRGGWLWVQRVTEETGKKNLQLCNQNLNPEPQECEAVVPPSQTRHSGTEFLTHSLP